MAEEKRWSIHSVSEGGRVEQKIEPALFPVRELEEREFEPATSKIFLLVSNRSKQVEPFSSYRRG